ncbi:MAG: hypothetical protein R3B91_09480 [Planctomycetaceae bacterium]
MLASEWGNQPIGAPDVIVLGNVETLSPERVQELESLVEAGAGLMIFSGEQVDVEEYNRLLYRGGEGLLPMRITEVRDADTSGLVIRPHADSPLSPLLKLSPESLGRVRPRRFVSTSVEEELNPDVRVLARWNNPASSPAVIEKRFGDGRVLFWTMTADRDWSDWPTEASYVLAMRMAADSVAARLLRWENVTAGQPLRYPLDPEFAPQTAKLSIPPTGDEVRFQSIERRMAFRCWTRDDTAGRPLSGVVGRSGDRGADASVRCPSGVSDSELERLDGSELEQFLGRLTPQLIRFTGESMDVTTAGTELWRYAVLVLVSLIVVESLLAPGSGGCGETSNRNSVRHRCPSWTSGGSWRLEWLSLPDGDRMLCCSQGCSSPRWGFGRSIAGKANTFTWPNGACCGECGWLCWGSWSGCCWSRCSFS